VDYSSAGWFEPPKGLGTGFWLHVTGYFIAGGLYFFAFGNKGQMGSGGRPLEYWLIDDCLRQG